MAKQKRSAKPANSCGARRKAMTSKKPDRERRYADGRGTVLFGESHCSITVDRLMDMDTRKVKPPTVRLGPLSFSIEDADQFLADLTDAWNNISASSNYSSIQFRVQLLQRLNLAIEYARAWAKETGNG